MTAFVCRTFRSGAIAILGFASFSLPVAAQLPSALQPRDRPAVPTSGTASITGVVTTDGQNPQPLRKVRVTLNHVNRSIPGRTQTTDDAGRFAFGNLPAERFLLSASRPGFLTTNYGASRPERSGTPIALAAGQQLAGLVLRVARGAVVSGTVRDQVGQPIPGAQVMVLRYGYSTMSGERQLGLQTMGGMALTDDRGMYRAWGLSDGEYAVRVNIPGGRGPASTGLDEMRRLSASDIDAVLLAARGGGAARAGSAPPPPPPAPAKPVAYAPVFYPDAMDVGSSTVVTLGPGDERDGIDVTVAFVSTARIDGRIQLLNAPLPPTVIVTLSPANVQVPISGGTPAVAPTARMDRDGKFTFQGIGPGRYTLTAKSGAPPPRGGGSPSATPAWWAASDISIDGRDVEVAMELQPPMKVTGRMVFEGAPEPPKGLSGIQILLMPPGAGGNLNAGLAGQVNDQGQFEILGVVPGLYRPTTLMSGTALSSWFAKAATINGRGVTDAEIQIKPNEQIDWVLTYTDKPAELSGTLQDATGRAATDYFVLAYPADRNLWRPQSVRVRNVRPATDGQFSLRGLPPGEYLLAALTDLENGEWNSPTFLASLIPASIKVTLVEGQTTKQDLKLAGR